MSDFVMTFPAFIPLNADDVPEVVDIDGATCLCLFTERRLLETFCRRRSAAVTARRRIQTYSFADASKLVEFLSPNAEQYEAQGCRHVAFNVDRGRPPMYAPIVDFLDYLRTL